MSLRSCTEYEITALPKHNMIPPLIRHAGFRRHDGSLMPIRRPVRICTCIFYGGTEFAEIGIYPNKKFLLRVLSVSALSFGKLTNTA